MTPRQTDTRRRLVQAARELFLEKGFTATGVAELLSRAGARTGSFYYYFSTKEALLLAVLDQYQELLWPVVIQPVFEATDDPIERIFGVLGGYRRMLQETAYRQGCPIGNLALEVADHSEDARERIAVNFTNWRLAIQGCLDDAAARLPGDVDRERLAIFVLTTMEGAVMLTRAYRNLEAFDAAVAQLRDHFDRLLIDERKSSS